VTLTTRFAPSPTGYLHYGHAYAARQAFDFAKKHEGTCILRIEDTDHTRCKDEYRTAILDDLKWLGFTWPEPVRIQSRYLPDYEAVITTLEHLGVLYRCFKSRKQLRESPHVGSPDPDETALIKNNHPFSLRLSIKHCREHLGLDELSYRRMDMNSQIHEVSVSISGLNDEIVVRKDSGTSYLIACTHDDMIQNITHIVRGTDITPFTPYQVLIQKLMNWPTPIYVHHPVIKNAAGMKLSKRNQDTTIRALREQGFTAQAVFDMATP